jgi:hypothetical protein
MIEESEKSYHKAIHYASGFDMLAICKPKYTYRSTNHADSVTCFDCKALIDANRKPFQ